MSRRCSPTPMVGMWWCSWPSPTATTTTGTSSRPGRCGPTRWSCSTSWSQGVAMKRDKRINDGLGGSLADALASGADAPLATPDTGTPMVSRSLRLPLETYERLQAAAAARRLPITTLMRDLIEAGPAGLEGPATLPLAHVRAGPGAPGLSAAPAGGGPPR